MKKRKISSFCHNVLFYGFSLLRLFLCLGMSLCLSSCGSKRRVSDSRIDQDLTRKIELMVNDMIRRKVVEIHTSDIITDIVLTDKRFDTDKAIDPSTGERPVESITDAHIVISRRDSSTTADSLGIDKIANKVEDIDQRTDIKADNLEEKRESRWPIAVMIVSLSVMVIAVIILIIRVQNRNEKKVF